jgi:hypothetical protein
VTAGDLDVLAARPVVLAAYTPVRDAVALAVDRRRGNRRRGADALDHLRHLARQVAAGGELEEARQRGGARDVAERATERDDLAHAGRHELGDLARVDAAQAPADDRDLPLVARVELRRAVDQALAHEVRRAQVAAEQQHHRCVAEALQVAAQDARRLVGRHEAGHHQDGVAVASRRALEEARGGEVGQPLRERALAFECEEGERSGE